MTTALSLEAAVRTDVGPVRRNNEDAAFASPRMAAVADGVGGAAAGEVASRAAIDALVALDKCRLDPPLPAACGRRRGARRRPEPAGPGGREPARPPRRPAAAVLGRAERLRRGRR